MATTILEGTKRSLTAEKVSSSKRRRRRNQAVKRRMWSSTRWARHVDDLVAAPCGEAVSNVSVCDEKKKKVQFADSDVQAAQPGALAELEAFRLNIAQEMESMRNQMLEEMKNERQKLLEQVQQNLREEISTVRQLSKQAQQEMRVVDENIKSEKEDMVEQCHQGVHASADYEPAKPSNDCVVELPTIVPDDFYVEQAT